MPQKGSELKAVNYFTVVRGRQNKRGSAHLLLRLVI